MAGFMTGEGCFYIYHSSKTRNISLGIKITQNIRDLELLKSFIEYFGCGTVYGPLKDGTAYYNCTAFKDILEKIIPIFHMYPVEGVKAKNYQDFVVVANMIKNKNHLSIEGYKQIILIKQEMNKGRKFDG
jgi:hypothetical protein